MSDPGPRCCVCSREVRPRHEDAAEGPADMMMRGTVIACRSCFEKPRALRRHLRFPATRQDFLDAVKRMGGSVDRSPSPD